MELVEGFRLQADEGYEFSKYYVREDSYCANVEGKEN